VEIRNIHLFEATAVAILLLSAAWRDVATRTLYDSVSIVIAVCGLIDRALIGPSPLLISLAASVVLFLVLLLVHTRGMLGGGDVKLMAAIACGLSLPQLFQFLLVTAWSGGVLAGIHLCLRRALRGLKPMEPPPRGSAGLYRVLIAERWRIARRGPLPYGVAIACGGLVAIGPRVTW
jgi:prepilin peptidase CpaA